MKKLLYFLVCVFIFSSCLSEKDEEILTVKELEGSEQNDSAELGEASTRGIKDCYQRQTVDWFGLADSYVPPAVAPTFRQYLDGELDETINDCLFSNAPCPGPGAKYVTFEVLLDCTNQMFDPALQDAIINDAKNGAILNAPECSPGVNGTPVFYDFFLEHDPTFTCDPPFFFDGIIYVQVEYCCAGGGDPGGPGGL